MILAILIPALVVAWVGGHFLRKAYALVSTADVGALHTLSGVPASPATDSLFAAYLSRARRYRTGWSVAAWVSAIVLTAGLGIGFLDLSELVILGFAGYLAGAVVAELHHLRRPRTGTRTASLAPRRIDTYLSRRYRWGIRVAGLAALAVLGAGLAVNASDRDVVVHVPPSDVVDKANDFAIPLVLFAFLALAVWLVVERAERAVVHRPRPAMPDGLARGDDAIRTASLQALALGGSGIVALCVAAEFATVHSPYDSWLQLATILGSVLFFSVAVILALSARRIAWPLRRLEVDGDRA